MLNKSKLISQSVFLCLLLIVISGCSGLNENPAGNFNSDRGASEDPVIIDEPVAIIDFPFGPPDENPTMLDDPPVELLMGEHVTFYTWQSDGSLVTNEEYHMEYDGLVHPWDYHLLTLVEFIALYGDDIELTCEEPWDGLILCEPYQVDVNVVMNVDDMDPDIVALITPEMTIYEAHDEMMNYLRTEGSDDRKVLGDVRTSTARRPINSYDLPSWNIKMDVCDWVILSHDKTEWVYDIFGNQYYTHAALVGYCGDGRTGDPGSYPRSYDWVGGHPDKYGDGGSGPDGRIDLWDASVYEAIGLKLHLSKQVGHYQYRRGFIDPTRRCIQEISFNYSPAVWADPNWIAIINGIWEYAWSQNHCFWWFPQDKEKYGAPESLGHKHTYCSLLVWQAYMYSTHFNASTYKAYELDLDWNGLSLVWPGDLQQHWNGDLAKEWGYWKR